MEFLKKICGQNEEYGGWKKIREDGYSEKVVFREEDFERGKGG